MAERRGIENADPESGRSVHPERPLLTRMRAQEAAESSAAAEEQQRPGNGHARVDVAGVLDGAPEHLRRQRGGVSGRTHRGRIRDQQSERPIEPPLRRELPRARLGETNVCIRDLSGRQRVQRFECGQLAAAKGKAQPVAGHRVDKAGGIAGKQQPRRPRAGAVDAERAEA